MEVDHGINSAGLFGDDLVDDNGTSIRLPAQHRPGVSGCASPSAPTMEKFFQLSSAYRFTLPFPSTCGERPFAVAEGFAWRSAESTGGAARRPPGSAE
jgi:hypothetical protein